MTEQLKDRPVITNITNYSSRKSNNIPSMCFTASYKLKVVFDMCKSWSIQRKVNDVGEERRQDSLTWECPRLTSKYGFKVYPQVLILVIRRGDLKL